MTEEKKDTTVEETISEEKVEETTTETPEENTAEVKEEKQEENKKPELKPGMTIRVYQKIKEKNIKGEEKERLQYFEGMVIAKKHGNEAGGSITVRKTSNGVGVEKIFPLNLPTIDRIEIKKEARVRRAKLFFLREGFKKKLKERIFKAK